MKLYGDVPEDHHVLLRELETLEAWFKDHSDDVPILVAAKGFVCMSHDYYQIGLEEEGERMLKKANKICPSYFRGPILSHIQSDSDYAYLVGRMTEDDLAAKTMRSLGFEL